MAESRHDDTWKKDYITDYESWNRKLNAGKQSYSCQYPTDIPYSSPARKFKSGMGGPRFLKRRREQR